MARKRREAVSELVDLQEGYWTRLDSLPENLAESATAEALRAICDLDLSELDSARQVIPSRRRIALIRGRVGAELPRSNIYSSKSVKPARARLSAGCSEEGFSASSLTRA
jgi:hypothetical protein